MRVWCEKGEKTVLHNFSFCGSDPYYNSGVEGNDGVVLDRVLAQSLPHLEAGRDQSGTRP